MATSVPLTQTSAWPITPLMTSLASWPGRKLGVKSVRNHQGTLNSGLVSAPSLVCGGPKHCCMLLE